jgi:transcriptional regulator with XRE-family HTH domain
VIDRLVGERIRQARQSREISMEWLAERIGVSHQMVWRYENGRGRISVVRLVACAAALECDVGTLIPDAIHAQAS